MKPPAWAGGVPPPGGSPLVRVSDLLAVLEDTDPDTPVYVGHAATDGTPVWAVVGHDTDTHRAILLVTALPLGS